MNFLPFLHFLVFIVFIYLAVFILYKDSKSQLNWTSSILMLCFALWNFGDIILQNPDRTIQICTVMIMQDIATIGWVGFASTLFSFSLAFSKKEKLLKKKWFLFFVLILPVCFIYKQWTGGMTINPTRQPYGWSLSWANTIWTYLFYVYYSLLTLFSLYFIYFYGRKTKTIIEKKQAKIIAFSIFASLIVGTVFDVVIPELNNYSIPPLGNLFVSFFAAGLIYAIVKYRFLMLTPAIAAENIISAMDELLILLDQEANILTVNNATLDSLQFEKKELEGKSIAVLFQDDNYKKYILEKITKEEVLINHNSNFLTKTGKIIPVIYSGSPLKNENGIMIGTVIIARDITGLIQKEKELIIARDKAEESDRLKSAFLANMSHEIRTPMNGILGFADLLKAPNITAETQQNYIRIIEKSGVRLLNIINDIVDISKIESGQMEVNMKESNINEQIEYIYTFFKPEVEGKGMQFSFKNSLPLKEAIIITDHEKIFAILTNLVKNAIKYSNEGSIEFGYDKRGEYLEFFVNDTGIGIPEDRQDAIFERFIQANIVDKMARQGAGLGLSISKAYVEALGGEIWVNSKEGKGSIFYFTIPYNTEPHAKSDITTFVSNEGKEVKIRNLKILIVEDDETSNLLISIMIEKISREILHAKSGFEAIELCHNKPDIDLVLMDIQMPAMNGYKATQQIRQFNKDVIIIAQTAFGLLGDREKAIEAGCNDYISKPVVKDNLLALIQKYFKK
jgi:PAS domain S-box-containing protein